MSKAIFLTRVLSVALVCGLSLSSVSLGQDDSVNQADSSHDGEFQLTEALSGIVDQIAGRVKLEGYAKNIVVEPFGNKFDKSMTSGAGILVGLKKRFEAAGFTVSTQADLNLSGAYQVGAATTSGGDTRASAMITYVLQHRSGQVLIDSSRQVPKIRKRKLERSDGESLEQQFVPKNPGVKQPPALVTDPVDALKLQGATVELPDHEGVTKKQKDEFHQIAAAVLNSNDKNNGVHIDGDRIYANKDSPISIRVVKAKANDKKTAALGSLKPVTPKLRDNGVFAEVARNEVFCVEVFNDSNDEMVAGIFIDGINSFAFSSDMSNTRFMLVPPNSKQTFFGWHKNKKQYNSFLVDEHSLADDVDDLLQDVPIGSFLVEVRKTVNDSSRGISEGGIVPGTGETKQVSRRISKRPKALITVHYEKN